MANESIKEVSPFMTPDSLRATLKSLKHFNDLHTKRYQSYEDVKGSKYVGTVENFGDELLIESRKLLMDKPPLKSLFSINTFTEYFNIEYSDLIDTYSQQNMLVAILKTDALVSTHNYHIEYTDCELDVVYRSESWGTYDEKISPTVIRDSFYKTTTPPVLVIENPALHIEPTRIPLKLEVNDVSQTTYFMHYDTTTEDMYDAKPTPGADGKYSFSIDINKNQSGLPFVWMTNDVFLTFPNIDLCYVYEGFTSTCPPLSLGTDGQNITKVFPYTDPSCLPDDSINDWMMYAIPMGDLIKDDIKENLSMTISQIEITNGVESIKVHYDLSVAKISLIDCGWELYEDEERGLIAKISLSKFANNALPNKVPTAAMIVHFDDVALKYEGERNSVTSGIHVDAGTDYTNHSVIKYDGIVHNLDGFDGLPSYFGNLLSREIHRSHVEVYTIRNRIHDINEQTHEKQTAALILDSAIPQKELHKLGKDVPIVIRYVASSQKYETVGEPPSVNNSLSEITYVDNNKFGNINIFGQYKLPQFIYHGNRTFSTGTGELDPELEYGRVYIISNDPIAYSNNGSNESEYHKSSRTFARICDIPTDYGQLIHVKHIAPTVVFDDKYTPSEVGYTKEDKEYLYNGLFSLYAYFNTGESIPHNTHKLIFKKTENLDSYLTYPYLKSEYLKYAKLSLPVKISNSLNVTFEIQNNGTGYAVGDTFYFLIGGRAFDCTVDTVSGNGLVTAFSIVTDISAIEIPQSNLDGPVTIFKTVTTSSVNGKGLQIKLTVNPSYWDSIQPTREDDVPDGLFAFKYDEFDNIWIWEFNVTTHKWEQKVQVTGEPVTHNYYDLNNRYSRTDRTLKNVMMYNFLNSQNKIDETYANDPMCLNKTLSNDVEVIHQTRILDHDYNPNRNNAESITMMNKNGGIYLTKEGEESNQMDVTMVNYNIPHNGTDKTNSVLLPMLHNVNTIEYYNKSNKFMVSSVDGYQPSLILYSPTRSFMTKTPNISTSENVKLTTDEYPITYYDALSNDTDNSWILRDGTTTSTIYEYNEFDPDPIYNTICENVDKKDESELLSMLDEFGYDHSSLNYDIDTLRAYVKRVCYDGSVNPVYKKNDIVKVRDINETVMTRKNNHVEPVGKQQRGAYINVSDEEYNVSVSIDKSEAYGIPLYFFVIEDTDVSVIPSSYRVTDACGNDISEYSVLILDHIRYVFRNNTWVPIKSKN